MKFFEDCSQFFDDIMRQLKHIKNNYHHYFADLLMVFNFPSIQENLYMIHSISNLLFEGGNTIIQYYQEQTRFL